MLGEQEIAFIAARGSFYLASVSETGWPHVQHGSGPTGFVRSVNDRTIGWADYVGNCQYVSAGNTAVNDRVAMVFMDHPHRERLKGHGQPVSNRVQLQEYRDMLVAIRGNVATLKQQGRAVADTVGAKPTAAFDAKWGGFVIDPAFFARLVYQGVRSLARAHRPFQPGCGMPILALPVRWLWR